MVTGLRRFEFNPDKLSELMLYIAECSVDDPRFGATKLNKILFYADFLAYGLHGKPVTGATYQRLTRGPAPRQLLPTQERLIKDGDAALVDRQYFNHRQRRLLPLRSARLGSFTPDEIALVDRVIEMFRHDNATGISLFSHGEMGWRLARDNDDIPYETVFLSSQAPMPDDIRRGRELASRYGWTGITSTAPSAQGPAVR